MKKRKTSRPEDALLPSFDPDAELAVRRSRAYREAVVEWLRNAKWTHFATLTFSRSSDAFEAPKHLTRWLREVQRWAGGVVHFFWVAERGKLNERPHIHAVLNHPEGASTLPAEWRLGGSEIRKYESELVLRYIVKALDSDDTEFEVDARMRMALAESFSDRVSNDELAELEIRTMRSSSEDASREEVAVSAEQRGTRGMATPRQTETLGGPDGTSADKPQADPADA